MSNEVQIQWPEWSAIINERFVPLIENRDRILILYGGRGSSKSDFWSKKLIYRCLTEKYFRYLLIRNEYSTIKESSYQTLKDNIYDLGLEDMFEFRVSPLEIICVNGNRFIARGCDDVTRLKSVKDVTGAIFEEDIISESDFITISSSIRTSKADYLQLIFSVNPEVEGDYMQNWFYKRFFEGKDELSFSGSTTTQVDAHTSITVSYTAMHSTYADNKWIGPEFIAEMKELQKQNSYYHTIYCLGRWGNKVTGGTFFKQFSIGKNTGPVKYNPAMALWCSFDFNTQPGVSCGIFQAENKRLVMIDEIQLKSPNNNTSAVCREICRKYNEHTSGMFVTSDASGRHADTRTEQGHNDIVIIIQALKQFRATDRVPKLNPPVVPSAGFINSIFEAGADKYKGIEIIIGDKCTKMISDLLYLLEDSDGTALKQKVRDKDTGGTYERYGHFGDLFRYAVCIIFRDEFETYKRGGKTGFSISYGKNVRSSRNWCDNY